MVKKKRKVFFTQSLIIFSTLLATRVQTVQSHGRCYKKKTGECPTLVRNNINRLAQKEPEILEILQEGARDAVSANTFTVVLLPAKDLLQNKFLVRQFNLKS
jgi:hypothetical protein